MHKLVLLRHGESVWNVENRFTGWTDVELSAQGIKEATVAGQLLKQEKFSFDIAYTSLLKRAIRTLWLVQDAMDLMWLPVIKSWKLNERHYGALQGLNKAQTAEKYGEEQVHIWRRSFATQPPTLLETDPRYPGHDARYRDIPKSELPLTESLQDTIARFLPFWEETIRPTIRSGKRVLISAHGNSLRALVMLLDNISEHDISSIEIPTGVPLIYELDDSLTPLNKYYLTHK